MTQFPFMRLYVESWVAATCHLSIAQRGAYMDLLVLMWRTPGCRVPNDNGWLQQHLRCSKDELRDLFRPVIEEFCRIDGGFVCQKRLLHEHEEAIGTRNKQSTRAKARWAKQKAMKSGNASDGSRPDG